MTVNVRLFLSSITGLCFRFPLGWGVSWAVPSGVRGIVSGIVVALMAYRLRYPLTQLEQPLAERDDC